MQKYFLKEYRTDRLILRKFMDEDVFDVFEYSSDDETTNFLTWKSHKNIEETIFSINNFLKKDGVFAIVLKSSKKVIGCIDLMIENDNKATFGYVLNKKYWRNGFMSEALLKIINIAFNEFSLDEVFGLCEIDNKASAKVMEKCGMIQISTLKNKQINNKIADYYKYSIKREF